MSFVLFNGETSKNRVKRHAYQRHSGGFHLVSTWESADSRQVVNRQAQLWRRGWKSDLGYSKGESTFFSDTIRLRNWKFLVNIALVVLSQINIRTSQVLTNCTDGITSLYLLMQAGKTI